MSESSNEKQTVVKTASEGQTVAVSTHVFNHIRWARAVVLVEVYADQPYEGPDTLVLRSEEEGDPARADHLYWKEIAVADAEHSGTSIECAFAVEKNEGTAQTREDLAGRRYTLAWRPTGEEASEHVLLENAAYETVWSVGETRHVAAGLTAVRFQECPDVDFGMADELQVPDLPEGLEEKHTPFDEGYGTFPEPNPDSAEPVEKRTGDGDEGLPAGERWVYLFEYREWADEGSAVEEGFSFDPLGIYAATEEGKYKRAEYGDDGSLSLADEAQADVLIPAFTAEDEQRATYARLSMVGVPQKRHWEMVGEIMNNKNDSWSTLTPLNFQLASGGQAQMTLHNTCPMPFMDASAPCSAAQYLEKAPDVPGCPVNLSSPLGVPKARLEQAEQALRERQAWERRLGGVGELSSLMGRPCFDPTHRREHLQRELDERVEVYQNTGGYMQFGFTEDVVDEFDLQTDWSPFTPADGEVQTGGVTVTAEAEEAADADSKGEAPSDGSPTAYSHKLLGQFLHGLRCKRSYLTWAQEHPTWAADRAFDRPLFRHLIFDAYATVWDAEEDETPPGVEALRSSLFPLYPRLLAVGGGRTLAGQVPSGGVDEDLFDEAESLEETEYARVFEQIKKEPGEVEKLADDPLFKALFKVAQGGTNALHQLALGVSTTYIVWGMGAPRGRRAPDGVVLLGAHLMEGAQDSFEMTRETGEDGGTRCLTYSSEKSELTLEWTAVEEGAPEGRARHAWQLSARGPVGARLDDAFTPVQQVLDTSVKGLDLLNFSLALYTATEKHGRGSLTVGDALGVAGATTDVAGMVLSKTGSASRIASLLRVAGPVLTGVEGVYKVVEELTERSPRGLAEVPDPDVVGAAGQTMVATGASLLAVGATSSMLTMGIGGGLMALGGLVIWVGHLRKEWEEAEADPLGPWLRSQHFWGTEYSARGEQKVRKLLFHLVAPTTQLEDASVSDLRLDGKTVPERFGAQAETFTQKAFFFPTDVRSKRERPVDLPPGEEPAVRGLTLSPALGYLPAYGTLMVNCEVQALRNGQTVGDPISIECAIHYVDDGDQTRYVVKPAPNGTAEPLRVQPEMTLSEQAEFEDWALARERTVTVGTETLEAPTLPIHVGPVWQAQEEGPEPIEKQQYAPQDQMSLRQSKAEIFKRDFVYPYQVEAKTHLEGPGGLEAILESGAFRVEGYVSFSPLQPFQPEPEIPEGDPLEESRMLSRTRVKYSYPG